ncbi:HAD-IA family hydrolase [Herbaspirillum lusitanum]|uniref:HAD-IA family hydrolase n=1 Tax=Herbaspirillum lusitanum TaxID=213312 RepID=UPI00030787AC|nr:HAD-IA family hydrolase [Herbaspirillum lusitanum]
MKPAITHLVCDCDGVLLDSESIALRVLHEHLLPLLENPANGDKLHRAIASRLGMFTELLLDELEFGFGLNAAQYADINTAVGIACGDEVQLVPGIAEALQKIDLPKAVASNSSTDRIVKGLQRCDLLALFDGHIHSAHDVGRPKPAPHVYLAAAAGYGVAPQHCVAVDDSVTGVRAASSAGMRVLGFTGVAHDRHGMRQKLLDAGAELVFEDMQELPALIEALLTEQAA